MNFDNNDPIDVLVGRLVAFVIMFQKKIENIKCKLTANQRFHTRLAFNALDASRKNEINSQSLCTALSNSRFQENQFNCDLFLRKYSKHSTLTYDEFLKLLTPKGNPVLAQGILIRPYPKGAVLQPNLWECVLQLLQLYIKMCTVTESIRVAIQKSEHLSYLQLIQFFSLTIRSDTSLIKFIDRCSSGYQEYDIQTQDAVYLTYHLRSGHEISEFTDIDIKELLLPLNQSFQKQNTQQTFYKKVDHNYPKEAKQDYDQQINFLGKTYQKMYQKKESEKGAFGKKDMIDSSVKNNLESYAISNRLPSAVNQTSRTDNNYETLYIDNFTTSGINPVLELNQYISSNQNRSHRKQIEVFHDDLNSHSSNLSRRSRESAFERS